jgi:hypothetical protein
MYTKKWCDEGIEHIEIYQSWYDVLWEGLILGSLYVIAGLIMLICTPFLTIYSIWNPVCLGNSTIKSP